MYILIARASIPMMDKRSAEKRDGFSDYCKNTPPLLFNFSKQNETKFFIFLNFA